MTSFKKQPSTTVNARYISALKLIKKDYLIKIFPFEHSHLLWQFTRRDVTSRYKGSLLGMGWALVSPLMMLAAFTLVFYGFFQLKWPAKTTGSETMDFSLQVFVGLIFFNWFAEIINRAPGLIVSQQNLVTKVVFPLNVLVWSMVLSISFHTAFSLILLLLVTSVLAGISISWLTLPLLIFPYIILMVGIALIISALGVYLRDIAPFINLSTSVLMFLSPIFYPVSTVPEKWQSIYLLNPLALLITQLRNIVFEKEWPNSITLISYYVISIVVLSAATYLFNKLKGGFADVL